MALGHVIEAQQFDRDLLEHIFAITDSMKKQGCPGLLQEKLMACLFYEPSTRTRFSFQSAMYRLGGQVLVTDNAGQFSSAAKGETLEDTIRVVSSYVDVIVLRHTAEGAARRAASVADVPIINAGDGAGQHPTQSLLDVYTIADELGSPEGAHVAIVGDLKYGRTARSLAYLLSKYDRIRISFVSPPELRMGEDITSYCAENGVLVDERCDLGSVVEDVDCIYMTRIQKERMTPEEYAITKNSFTLSPDLVERMKPEAIIMHPLPRMEEIPPSVDSDGRVSYFKQAENGLYLRMALLKMLLE